MNSIRFSIEIFIFGFLCSVIAHNSVWARSTNGNGASNNTTIKHFDQRSIRSQRSSEGVETSRQFGGEEKFQNWKVWDNPEDQLAIESIETIGNEMGNKPNRRGKNKNRTANATTSGNQRETGSGVEEKIIAEETGTQRNDCNSNLQVSTLPIMLAFIAVVVGVIAVFILWVIAKAFLSAGSILGNSNSGGYGASSQQNGGGGWSSKKRYDLTGFSRSLKNVDFDQLTQMVTNGIQMYKKIFEGKSV